MTANFKYYENQMHKSPCLTFELLKTRPTNLLDKNKGKKRCVFLPCFYRGGNIVLNLTIYKGSVTIDLLYILVVYKCDDSPLFLLGFFIGNTLS